MTAGSRLWMGRTGISLTVLLPLAVEAKWKKAWRKAGVGWTTVSSQPLPRGLGQCKGESREDNTGRERA